MIDIQSIRATEEEQRAKTRAVGYDYRLSKMSRREQVEKCDPVRLRQYLTDVITGGELDCLTDWGYMPWILYNVLECTI